MAARDFTDEMSELALGGLGRTSEAGEPEGGTDGGSESEGADSGTVFIEVEVDEASNGRERRHKVKKAKVTRVARIERFGVPIMRTSGMIADLWEQFANALSPPAPFLPDIARVRLVRYLVPVPLAGLLLSPGTIVSFISFAIGFLFFGAPLFSLLGEILDVNKPGWRNRWRDRQ